MLFTPQFSALAAFLSGDLGGQKPWLVFMLLLLLLTSCHDTAEQAHIAPGQTSAALVDASVSIDFETQWVITAQEARTLLPQATLLDARGPSALSNPLSANSVEGAIAVTWQQFSEPQAPHRGNLLSDPTELERRLQEVGIDSDRPVIVFGNPSQGWGEEGRIVWMLRSLGHQQAVLVDGGYAALKAVGLTTGKATKLASTPGKFVPQPQETWQIDQATLREAIAAQASGGIAGQAAELVLVDTRETREFAGATPYGETRGGHLPGAVNLHFSQLLDQQGYLLPEAEIRDRLASLSITSEQTIVAYCTGGIRSGWLTAVLVELGYNVKNYAGSMWEWSAADVQLYPLENTE